MSEVDILILAVMVISALFSCLRGFMREAMSVGTWLAALLITLTFTSRFATLLPIESVQSPQARATVSAVILFIGTLVVGNLINWIFGKILAHSHLSLSDRAAGAIFGVVRGAIIVTLMVLAANLLPELKQEAWWGESSMLPVFQNTAAFIHEQLPANVGQHFNFTTTGY